MNTYIEVKFDVRYSLWYVSRRAKSRIKSDPRLYLWLLKALFDANVTHIVKYFSFNITITWGLNHKTLQPYFSKLTYFFLKNV